MNKPQDYVFALHKRAFQGLEQPNSRFIPMHWPAALARLNQYTAVLRQDMLQYMPEFYELVPSVLVRRDHKNAPPQFLAYQDPDHWGDMHRLLFNLDMNHRHAEVPAHDVQRDTLHLPVCLQQSVNEGLKKVFGDEADYLYEEQITQAFRGFLIDAGTGNASMTDAFASVGLVFELEAQDFTYRPNLPNTVEPPYKWLGFDSMSNHDRFGHDYWSETIKRFALEQKVDDVQSAVRHDDSDLPSFEIWAEGYSATGNASPARFVTRTQAPTFVEAVQKYVATLDKEAASYFDLRNPERLTRWGCRLFDNEADARRSFG